MTMNSLPDCDKVAGMETELPFVLPPYPRDMPVHLIFAWQANKYPNSPAVLCGRKSISYRELDEWSNQVARRLSKIGVKHGSIVGLLTNRSAETIVAWLAVLKCGATYMPLDPSYPSSALSFMLRDSNPVLVLAERELLKNGLFIEGLAIRILEDEFALAAHELTERFLTPVSALDAAYIMYTSGSTGRPKGVIVPHRAIVRLVRDQNYMDFSSNEVFLLISSLAFDASTWEVWGALLNGGRLAVVTSPHLSIDQIAEAISVYGVTSMFLTSALFHAVVDHNVSALRGVRQLIVGGDVLSSLHSQKAMSSLPDCQLINGYGPTEATTFSLCYRLPRHECADASIPIGRPIAHSAAYILDERLCPVPDGEVGSLWIGGDGVAKGYLKRPELDAERFRVDPFTNDGSLMYLTGDLASRRSDGEFEFLGRNDRQVKINGKRIELDEIEHVLRRDHRLADAIVVLRKESEDSKKIVAFLKPASLSAANGLVDFVLQDLRQRLPPHMVPHETALVEKFPLTSNGKVDRNALLEMVRQPVTSPLGGAIGTGLEKAISEIWERALARPVTSEANFFDLGGTSLQMIRVHAELRSAIAPNVAIIDLFAHPTVAGLARFLEGGPGRTVCSEPRCVGTNTPQNKPHASAGPNWDKPRDIASLRAKILRATRA